MPRVERVEDTAPLTPLVSVEETISIELSRGQGTAEFRVPTVDDMRLAERAKGAFAGTYQPEFFRVLAKRCLTSWGGGTTAPAEIRAADDQAIIRLFLDRFTEGLMEQAKAAGIEELPEGNAVVLSTGDRLLFRDLTQKDMKQIEALQGVGNIEPNVKLAIATCIEWSGKQLGFGELSKRFGAMTDGNYFRVVEALNAFL